MAETLLDYREMGSTAATPSQRQAPSEAHSPQAQAQAHAADSPTPPPSPATMRRRLKRKKKDPFLNLSAAPADSISASSTPPNETVADEHDSQWRITKMLLTPFLATSFFLSLALVSLSDRARRARTYPFPWLDPEPYSYPSSSDSDSAHPADQPHQHPPSGRWKRRDSAHVAPSEPLNPGGMMGGISEEKEEGSTGGEKDARSRKSKGKKRWYLHKKIRKMARLEVTDAFELRRWIMAIMLVAVFLGLVGMVWGVWRMLGWLRRRWW